MNLSGEREETCIPIYSAETAATQARYNPYCALLRRHGVV